MREIKFKKYTFGEDPKLEFGEDGILYGFTTYTLTENQHMQISKALPEMAEELKTSALQVGCLPDDRWVVMGWRNTGEPFWVEEAS